MLATRTNEVFTPACLSAWPASTNLCGLQVRPLDQFAAAAQLLCCRTPTRQRCKATCYRCLRNVRGGKKVPHSHCCADHDGLLTELSMQVMVSEPKAGRGSSDPATLLTTKELTIMLRCALALPIMCFVNKLWSQVRPLYLLREHWLRKRGACGHEVIM